MKNFNLGKFKSFPTIKSPFFYGKVATAILASSLILTGCSNLSEDQPINPSLGLEQQRVQLVQPQAELFKLSAKLNENLDGYEIAEGARKDNGSAKNRFNISLVFQDLGGLLPSATERQIQVFEEAAARWEKIIIKDVPSITAVGGVVPSAFQGFPAIVQEGGTIDDILIEVVLAGIDGPGGILGAAGPNFIRNVDNLTVTGFMFFDVADLDDLETLDLFDEVIVHEMGHVLGIGTLWDFERALIQPGQGGFPYFDGRWGNQFWKNEGGKEFLPIEFRGGQGTAFSHWDEVILNNELMTGFINLGENPLSRITAGSLRDLGYGTSMAAEKYDLPKGSQGIESLRQSDQGIDIASMEQLRGPIGIIEVK
jgi:hypothetical protein